MPGVYVIYRRKALRDKSLLQVPPTTGQSTILLFLMSLYLRRRRKVKEHVAKYSKHLEAVDCLKKSGKEPNESTYLNRNYNPVTVQEGHHYVKLSRVESRMVWIERYREEKKEDRKPVPAILAIPEENKACTVSTELEYEYDDILDYLLGTEPSVDSNNNVATCTSAKGEGKLEAQSQEKDDGDVDRKVDDRTVDDRTVEKKNDDERTVEKRKVDDRKVDDRTVEKKNDDERTVEKRKVDDRKVVDRTVEKKNDDERTVEKRKVDDRKEDDKTVEKRKDDNEKIEKKDDDSDKSDDDEDEMMNDTSDDSKSDDNNDHEMKSDTSDNSDDSESDNETSSSESDESDDDNGDDGHQQKDVRPQANRDERRRNDVREDLKALEELVRQQSTMINVTLNGMFHEMRTQTEILRQIRDISRSPLRRNAGVRQSEAEGKGNNRKMVDERNKEQERRKNEEKSNARRRLEYERNRREEDRRDTRKYEGGHTERRRQDQDRSRCRCRTYSFGQSHISFKKGKY